MIRELDIVILTQDIPNMGLEKGDMGTVVLVHNKGEGFEVEFITLDGETVAVTTLSTSQVRTIHQKEIAHARPLMTTLAMENV
jgi:hypothetical protein